MNSNVIPYGKQHITEEDISAVVDALRSDFLTQGPKILEFEDSFARYIGAKYAVAVSNGTAALHLCALALKVKPGDKVITTPITFAASANCIKYCGGDVVFSDIDPTTYLLDIAQLRKLLTESPKGTYSGVVVVDFGGRAIDLEQVRAVAEEYDLWVIEDACHAPGGYFEDSQKLKQYCGNGRFADLAIFSFHPVKHIACGEGGMITTNDENLYKELLRLRTHGITKNEEEFINSSYFANGTESDTYPNWYMEMQQLGYNYRITDFQAALGISQLKRADFGLERRRAIAERYSEAFKNKPYIIGQSGTVQGHAYHLYIVEVIDRLALYNYLRQFRIFAQIHYIPCHLMPYYKTFGWKEGDLPISENYYKHCLSLPMFPTLTELEQEFVIKKINDFYNE